MMPEQVMFSPGELILNMFTEFHPVSLLNVAKLQLLLKLNIQPLPTVSC